MIDVTEYYTRNFIIDLFHAFGCLLIEFGLCIYQKRKFSGRNWMAFYILKGGLLCIFSPNK